MNSYVAGLYETQILFCSGILMSEKYVVTVATCLTRFIYSYDYNFSNYHAKFGQFNLKKSDREYAFKNVKIHQGYNHTSEDLPDNIGLITVLNIIPILKRCKLISRAKKVSNIFQY